MRLSLIGHQTQIAIEAAAAAARSHIAHQQSPRALQSRVDPRLRARAGKGPASSQGAPHGRGRLQTRNAENGIPAVDPRLHCSHRAGYPARSLRRPRRLATSLRRAGCARHPQTERSKEEKTTPHPTTRGPATVTRPGCGQSPRAATENSASGAQAHASKRDSQRIDTDPGPSTARAPPKRKRRRARQVKNPRTHELNGVRETQGPLVRQPAPAARLARILHHTANDLWELCTLTDTNQMQHEANAIAKRILATCQNHNG